MDFQRRDFSTRAQSAANAPNKHAHVVTARAFNSQMYTQHITRQTFYRNIHMVLKVCSATYGPESKVAFKFWNCALTETSLTNLKWWGSRSTRRKPPTTGLIWTACCDLTTENLGEPRVEPLQPSHNGFKGKHTTTAPSRRPRVLLLAN